MGKELFNHAIKEKKITISKDVDITKIKKEALKKKSKIKELDEKVFSAIRFLNISDKEIKTYAILVSLGYANLQLLSRIMKIDESEIKINLNLLKERGWIENERDFYKPTNPTKVIKDEIYQFKREFQQNIERIKNEALTDLETLFIQNNLMNVRYKHFMDQIYERVI